MAPLVPVALYGLPLDFHSSYVQPIENVTQAEVRRVARQCVHRSRMAIVVIGEGA